MKGYLKAHEIMSRMVHGQQPRYTGNGLEVEFPDGQKGDSDTIRDLIKNKQIKMPLFAHEVGHQEETPEDRSTQESIRRVTDGRGCNDSDIKRVIALGTERQIAIGEQTYSLREIANAIKVAEMFAYHRWGAEWATEVGIA